MSDYSYEVLGSGRYTEYRIRDAQDSRIATCFDETNARTVVEALNHRAPAAGACETCAGIEAQLGPPHCSLRIYRVGDTYEIAQYSIEEHDSVQLGTGPTLAAAVAAARRPTA